MQPYQRTREQRDKNANVTGIAVTVAVHALALVICLTTGFSYLDPPPPERTSLVIEFEEETVPEKPIPAQAGREPQSQQVDLTRPVELVQQAESPTVSDRPNTTPATKPDPHGDVEVPTPKQEEPKLDPRASFPGMSTQDNTSTTPHSASEASEGFKAGQPDGNAQTGNQYGEVTDAIPGVEGTTVTDKNLWNAARNAALKAHFNQKADAPAVQLGTITYIFKLK